MNFKDQLKKDLEIFLNPFEFAEYHKLNSIETLMVIQEDDVQDQSMTYQNKYNNVAQNMFETLVTIYVKTQDFEKPDVHEKVTLDGKQYYVVSASVFGGLLKIRLKANEAY